MYYILTNKSENDYKDAILSGKSAYLNRIDCSFQHGIPLPSEDIDTPILFKIDEVCLRGTMTDRLSVDDIPGPVFSLRTKIRLERDGIKNIEYYQLTLLDGFPNGIKVESRTKEQAIKYEEYNEYFIANVIGLIDCVNHEKSELEYFYPPELRCLQQEDLTMDDDIKNPFEGENPNDIDFISKLVLDESKIDPSLKIFRLLDQPNLLVFHESVVEMIRKEKLSGFVFVPVEEYTDAIPNDDKKEDDDSKKPEPRKAAEKPKKPGFNFALG